MHNRYPRRHKPQKMRSPRRIALLDQVLALLRDSPEFLTANEIAERLGRGAYYSDVFPVLDFLSERSTIVKLAHPGLRNVLWGFSSQNPGFAYQFARLRAERDRLRLAIGLAPEPTSDDRWEQAYRDWWSGERRLALDA